MAVKQIKVVGFIEIELNSNNEADFISAAEARLSQQTFMEIAKPKVLTIEA